MNPRAVAKVGYVCWLFGQTRKVVWLVVNLRTVAKVEWIQVVWHGFYVFYACVKHDGVLV